jgi:hypothetical protein
MVETRLLQPIFEIFGAFNHSDGTVGGKHRSVRVGALAARSGATIRGGGKPGPAGCPPYPGPRLPTALLVGRSSSAGRRRSRWRVGDRRLGSRAGEH